MSYNNEYAHTEHNDYLLDSDGFINVSGKIEQLAHHSYHGVWIDSRRISVLIEGNKDSFLFVNDTKKHAKISKQLWDCLRHAKVLSLQCQPPAPEDVEQNLEHGLTTHIEIVDYKIINDAIKSHFTFDNVVELSPVRSEQNVFYKGKKIGYLHTCKGGVKASICRLFMHRHFNIDAVRKFYEHAFSSFSCARDNIMQWSHIEE